jgi:hypothetical protein
MADSPRPKPYVWVSWLTGLLAGMDHCVWKAWYKSHYRYAKVPREDEFDLQKWTREHDAMTAIRVAALKQDKAWSHIRVEEDNSFKLDGRGATLAGKPDIVAVNEQEKFALVIDEKSGRKKESDAWQVLIYMFALPLVWASGWRIEGEVEYRGERRSVPSDRMNEARPKILELMRIIGDPAAPLRSPSVSECRFCDVASCTSRMAGTTQSADASRFF